MFPCRGAEQESPPPAAMSGPILWIGRCALGGVSPAKARGRVLPEPPRGAGPSGFERRGLFYEMCIWDW